MLLGGCCCLVKAIARSVGRCWGVGVTWCRRAGAVSDRGSVLVPVLPSPCSALPPPPDRTTGAAGARQGIGPQEPVQLQGLSPETSDAGCLHKNVFFLGSISSSLSSDKYPHSPPRPASVAFQVFLLPAAIRMDKYMGYFLSQKVRSLLIVQFSYPSAFIFIVSRWAATL